MTLATIDAAAIETDSPSPRTTARAAGASPGGTIAPSTSADAGAQGRSATARRIARKLACRMFIASISATLATPTPIRAQPASAANSASRRAAHSRLLSSSPSGMHAGSSTTAAATTGPAHGPRPASSMPQTRPTAAASKA